MSNVKRLRKFVELTAQERGLVARAAFLMTAFRLGLWLLPFSRLVALTRRNEHHLPEAGRCDSARVAWAVHVVSRYVPGATCLVQALTAKALLESAGFPAHLHIGVDKAKDKGFEAHAWVECRGAVVIGASGVARFTPLLSVEGGR